MSLPQKAEPPPLQGEGFSFYKWHLLLPPISNGEGEGGLAHFLELNKHSFPLAP